MKDTNQLLTNIVKQQGSAETLPIIPPQTSSQSGDGDLMVQVINDLFIFLKGQYSSFDAKLRKPGIEDQLKREWARTLVANGVTSMEQISRGKDTIRITPGSWCPAITDFCDLCNTTSDMPTPSEAWAEASGKSHTVHPEEILGSNPRQWVVRSDHNWECPAVYEAGKRCGFTDIKQGKISGDQYKDIYKKVCREVLTGKSFDLPIYETENRITFEAKKSKTTTEQNKAARDLAMEQMKGYKL